MLLRCRWSLLAPPTTHRPWRPPAEALSLPVPDRAAQLPECTIAFCAACEPAEALEDESEETRDEVCTQCEADHVLSDDGGSS